MRGTKKRPLCTLCHGSGHYASTCPDLAAKALKALTKSVSSKDLAEHLSEQKPLKLKNMAGRPKRTLKRASGKRGFSSLKAQWKVKSEKGTRKWASAKKNKDESARKPRPRKDSAQKHSVARCAKPARAAHRALLKAGWCWRPRHCDVCGTEYQRVRWATCCRRAEGHLFVRCYTCNSRGLKGVVTCERLHLQAGRT